MDIDPGYTQFWHADGTLPLANHDVYFTIGEDIGAADCEIPAGGIEWRTVRQRVVLDRWPVTAAPNSCRFTTVASWRGAYGRVKFGGRSYGLKAHEFRKVIDLPRTTPSSSCWTIRPGSSRREGRAVAGAVASLVVNVSRTPAAPPQESECGGSH